MSMISAAKAIWRVESCGIGIRVEVWARERRCPAKAMAQRRVRRSPMPMEVKRLEAVVPEGVVRKRRPAKARRAPRYAARRGA